VGDEYSTVSEWNEQIPYSTIFFTITYKCREAQAREDYSGWKNQLEAKISMAMGISGTEEKETLVKFRTLINQDFQEFAKLPDMAQFNVARSRRISKLMDTLFYVEAEVDSMVNKHMPFLKLADHEDLGDV